MHYNDSKEKGCGKQSTANNPKSSSKSSTLSERPKNNHAKEELQQIKKSINAMRHNMYKVAGFEEGNSIVITDDAIKVSQELDVLITKYYQKIRM